MEECHANQSTSQWHENMCSIHVGARLRHQQFVIIALRQLPRYEDFLPRQANVILRIWAVKTISSHPNEQRMSLQTVQYTNETVSMSFICIENGFPSVLSNLKHRTSQLSV